MSTSSNDSVFSFGTTLQVLPPVNFTLSTYYGALPGQIGWQLKYQSGGTLWIVGTPNGTTLAGTALLGATMHYMMGATEVLQIDGPANFHLAVSGATTMVNVVRKFSAGF